MNDSAAPVLVFVVGPLAVGKMSVGQAIADPQRAHRTDPDGARGGQIASPGTSAQDGAVDGCGLREQ